MAASKKREKEGYDTQGLDSRQEVEQALAGAQYRPSQTVQQAAQQLQQMQGQRPAEYESAYQERMDQLLEKLMGRRASGIITSRTRCTASMPRRIPRTPKSQCRCGGAGSSADRRIRLQLCRQRSTAGVSAADQWTEQCDPHPVQSGRWIPIPARGRRWRASWNS